MLYCQDKYTPFFDSYSLPYCHYSPLYFLIPYINSYNLRCQETSSKGKTIEFELEICQLPDMDMVGKWPCIHYRHHIHSNNFCFNIQIIVIPLCKILIVILLMQVYVASVWREILGNSRRFVMTYSRRPSFKYLTMFRLCWFITVLLFYRCSIFCTFIMYFLS